MRSEPVTVRPHPISAISPALIRAAKAELRRQGVLFHQARIKLVGGRIELDLTTPQHELTRRGR